MESTYTEYVTALSDRYPTLTSLARFLREGSQNSVYPSGIQATNIHENGAVDQTRDITLAGLLDHIKYHATQPQTSGVVILLEDPGPVDMAKLGAALDINPLFFSGHVATEYGDVEKRPPPPIMTMFPSQVATENFIHIHFQKVIDLGEILPRGTPYKLIVPGNIPRHIRRMQTLSGRQLGLLRTCTSVYLKKLNDKTWVCLILVDSSTGDAAVYRTKGPNNQFDGLQFLQAPRRIRIEDIRKIPSYSSLERWLPNQSSMRASLFEYLTELFKTPPPGLQVRSPSVLSLAYYPLRIALSEWMLYCFLMSGYVKYYEYTFKNIHQRIDSAEDQDFMELHRWRRRSKQSMYKLQLLEGFVKHWRTNAAPCAEMDHLLQDIQHVKDQIGIYSKSLETKGSIITTMIQILDSRRSIEEAANVRHLTYAALVFIPLSYAATIFSMADDYGPGKKNFWVYFATAMPLTLLILAASRLSMQLQEPWNYFRALRGRERNRGNRNQLPL